MMRKIVSVTVALLAAISLTACADRPITKRPISPMDAVSLQAYVITSADDAREYQVSDPAQMGEIVDYLVRSRGHDSSAPKGEGIVYESFVVQLHDGTELRALHATRSPKENWIWTEDQGWLEVGTGDRFVGKNFVVGAGDEGTAISVDGVPMEDARGL